MHLLAMVVGGFCGYLFNIPVLLVLTFIGALVIAFLYMLDGELEKLTHWGWMIILGLSLIVMWLVAAACHWGAIHQWLRCAAPHLFR